MRSLYVLLLNQNDTVRRVLEEGRLSVDYRHVVHSEATRVPRGRLAGDVIHGDTG